MPALFIYLLKLSVSLAVVFLFYQLVLRKLTFYNSNRWYLLGYTILSFLIPFIDVSPVLKQNQWSETSIVQWVPVINNTELNIANETSSVVINYWFIGALMIGAGMLFMLCRLLVQFISFRRMRKKADPITIGFISDVEMKVYQVNESIIPFSFGSSIFINRNQHTAEELQEIIRHEFVHVKQGHSFDIIWGEILCMVNWYNPFAWLLKRSIRQNLEFIADNKVLGNGVSKKDYQYMLLKVIGNNQYSIATQFNFSSLKKRIVMMNKMKSAQLNLIKFLFILPLVAVMLLSFRQYHAKKESVSSGLLYAAGDTLPARPKAEIPDNVKSIHVDDDNKAVVKLSDGKTEKYDLNIAAEKAEFEKKYGEMPPPPPPPQMVPAIPPPIQLPENVSSIDVNNKQATVKLKNGNKEKYDLNNPKEKAEFEKKYCEILPPPPPPPAKTISGVSINTISENYEITDKKATMHLKDGTTEEYDLTNKEQKEKFEKKYGKIITVNASTDPVKTVTAISVEGIKAIAPIKVVTGTTINATVSPVSAKTVSGTSVITPKVATTVEGVAVISDYEYSITGEEDVLITITKNSTLQQLEEFKKQMKEKG
ncbi:MAG: M56 family metallopeptidase, partial [Chitinophagaceae bacterium]